MSSQPTPTPVLTSVIYPTYITLTTYTPTAPQVVVVTAAPPETRQQKKGR